VPFEKVPCFHGKGFFMPGKKEDLH